VIKNRVYLPSGGSVIKIGDLVKFVDGSVGLVVGTPNRYFVRVLWHRANTPQLAKIRNLEVISESR